MPEISLNQSIGVQVYLDGRALDAKIRKVIKNDLYNPKSDTNKKLDEKRENY